MHNYELYEIIILLKQQGFKCLVKSTYEYYNNFYQELCYILMCLPKVYKTLLCAFKIVIIIVRCKLFFLFTGREPTMWPADNCLQIMVCSCTMSSICVWLQRIFCSCVNESALFSFLRSLLPENGSFSKKFIKKRTWWLFIINNCYWTWLSQNIVICQINHLPSASPLTNPNILLNLVP